MAQTLFVQGKDKDGRNIMNEVQIIRSWQDSHGEQLYLHTNGIYGYKDGTPVIKKEEFGIIGDKIQRRFAEEWWDRIGKRISEDHYTKAEDALVARQEAGLAPVVQGDASVLDMALYKRRSLTGKDRKFGDPMTWYEWFNQRPEWWGHARVIEIAGFRYQQEAMVEEAAEEVEPPQKKVMNC